MKNQNIYFLFASLFISLASFAQVAPASNQPAVAITYRDIPKGKQIYGIFEGRPPCQEIARQMKLPAGNDCIKLKWRLFLFQDKNGQPTTYMLYGTFYIDQTRRGAWTISKGTKSDPGAIVFELDPGQPGKTFYLMKGDENVIFFLDEHKALRIGNPDFSYTLNRVKLVQGDLSKLKK